MARAEGEPKPITEKIKKYGLIAAIGGGIIFAVSASGVALVVGLGGGTAYMGARTFGNKGK